MIKENQRVLNSLNVISDGLIVFWMLPLAFWLRFYVLPGGIVTVPLRHYLILGLVLTIVHLFTFAAFGLYHSFRSISLIRELPRLWLAALLDMVLLLSWLFIQKGVHYSRLVMAIFLLLSVFVLSMKRVFLRKVLRRLRASGYNQKYVVLIGAGGLAESYLKGIRSDLELGYHALGYVNAAQIQREDAIPYLGTIEQLESILEEYCPDEVVSAIEMEDYRRTPEIIAACEKAGVKLSIVPFFAEFMPSNPQFDEVGGLPLLNIRRIPLDNWANAFVKRAMDIICSGILLIVTSPIMLICAIGVKLSSPGPIIFKQERVGRNKKNFFMYKFRSMKVNSTQDTGWSSDHDDRKTKFGSFIRKCSLDEFPQFFNVFKGDMSLVGPRPEVPFYVDQFKEKIPLYMVKHQVRPGITGWAQVNDLRGDTSIEARIEHDLYYIEHWSILLDLKILFMTLFGGKFMNSEKLN